MTAGLQVFDAAGKVTLDMTGRVPKIVSTVAVGSSAGSAGVALPGYAEPFLMFSPASFVDGAQNVLPAFDVSGNTVSWSFDTAYCISGLPINCVSGSLFVGAF